MAAPGAEGLDLAEVIVSLLGEVEGLRAHAYAADTVRPPAAVVGLPDVDYQDPEAGFSAATWVFPVTLVVSRSSDREAQAALSRLLGDVVDALGVDVPPTIRTLEPIDARPIAVTVSGQELPGYALNVRVRA